MVRLVLPISLQNHSVMVQLIQTMISTYFIQDVILWWLPLINDNWCNDSAELTCMYRQEEYHHKQVLSSHDYLFYQSSINDLK